MAEYKKEPLTKVQILARSYYGRKDVQKAMFEFCKGRETVANFNNQFFAKRPDCFDYPNDILTAANQGATSFHCSEERWEDPLKINTNMTPAQYNEIKTGWDFLIDIDAKYFDYAKIAARILLKTLEEHGARNVGIKFSGSKGFHILVPFEAFPKQVGESLTKDNFPGWARAIAGYMKMKTIKQITQEIIRMSGREKLAEQGELTSENICPLCGKTAETRTRTTYRCPNFRCKAEVKSTTTSKRKQLRCPSCNGNMDKIREEVVPYCSSCNVDLTKIRESASSYGGERRTFQ